jgi:hypothetical protein
MSTNIEIAQRVADAHQAEEIDGVLLDATTAALMVQVYGKLSTEALRTRFNALPLDKCAAVCWALVGRAKAATS